MGRWLDGIGLGAYNQPMHTACYDLGGWYCGRGCKAKAEGAGYDELGNAPSTPGSTGRRAAKAGLRRLDPVQDPRTLGRCSR